MIDSLLIVREARECIGTPYVHQGRLKGVGLDCLGLLIQVVKVSGIPLVGFIEHPYGQMNDGKLLKAQFDKHTTLIWDHSLTPKRAFQPYLKNADIVVLAWNKNAIHTGLVAVGKFGWNIIHAYSGCEFVTEHRLDDKWLSLVRLVYRFKDVG